MKVHLVNPSSVSFGTAVITPRWQYVIAAATPRSFGDPQLVDETLFQIDPEQIHPGDAIGIGIHTANALRGYEIGKMARERGAYVIFGGIHSTLFPDEAHQLGGLLGTWGAGQGRERHGLEQVGLPLRVAAEEHRGRALQRQVQLSVIAKVEQ